MNSIQTYVPKRDRFGKFKSIKYKKLAWKIIKFQLITLSLVTNIWFARHLYVFRCSAGGMLMTQTKCGELAQAKFDSTELARFEMLANNQDLYEK